jgi:hypothetical protein
MIEIPLKRIDRHATSTTIIGWPITATSGSRGARVSK